MVTLVGYAAGGSASGKPGLFPSQKLMPGSGINIQSECHPDLMRALKTAGWILVSRAQSKIDKV